MRSCDCLGYETAETAGSLSPTAPDEPLHKREMRGRRRHERVVSGGGTRLSNVSRSTSAGGCPAPDEPLHEREMRGLRQHFREAGSLTLSRALARRETVRQVECSGSRRKVTATAAENQRRLKQTAELQLCHYAQRSRSPATAGLRSRSGRPASGAPLQARMR